MKYIYAGLLSLFLVAFSIGEVSAQSLSTAVPENPDVHGTYLFYLHGGIVQEQGANAVSEHFGKYEYNAILDSLKNQGFYVLSEVRSKNTTEKEYAGKVNNQINALLRLGVSDKNIVVVGASLGAYIALETSILNENPNIRFVLLGVCSDYVLEYYLPFQKKFSGRFLSIYESSDSKGECSEIFSVHEDFKEIELEMGIGHAFLYRPYDNWVRPLVDWIRQSK